MKIKKNQISKKKIVFIGALLIAILALAGFGYYKYKHPSAAPASQETINYNPPTKDDAKAVDQIKEDIVKSEADKTKSEAPAQSAATVTIVRANQPERQPLSIRTLVSGATAGTCEISLSQAGQNTINLSQALVTEATSTTCGPVDVALADFPVGGDWQLKIFVKSTQDSAAITQTVRITK